ncbi:type VII secretion protein EccCa [Actinomycetospora sp. Odt1-22]|uniref:Type VII secretion protein EccCa n=2 Tax=Actinomycetospora termitidis TaxID=3053470 RepID=A0ABT7M463_9PSEU|nr:type VII secretion protein EccCa [Actinomycetospora sp. Odt1-22]MDL5155470.1 type VII secretion protein EccCa [Actinomycetospora sp. Odt1-22]
MPGGELAIEAPPEEPRIAPAGLLARLLPLAMVLASVGFVVVLGIDNPTSWLFGGMIALSTLGMVAGGLSRGGAQRRAEADAERADYLRYLAQVRRRARAVAVEQRASLQWTHPDPDALAGLARGPRTWERRPGDPDFAHVRVGRGAQRLATALVPPRTGPVSDLEPVTTSALRRFVRAHSVVEDLPTAVSLRAFAAVAVTGPDASPVGRERRRALARAVVAQLVTFHSPDDLLLAVVTDEATRSAWEWVKWLPHVAHPRLHDGAGPVRMIASSLGAVTSWLGPELADRPRFSRGAAPPAGAPHVVVVCDGGVVETGEGATADDLAEEGLAGVTLIDLDARLDPLVARRGLRLVVAPDPARGGPDRIGAATDAGVEWFGRPDVLRDPEAEALARRIAPCRTPASAPEGAGPAAPGLLDLLGVPGSPETFDVAAARRPRAPRDRLRVPFGLGEDGEPVELDLKESAQEGMGPHGLCVGATGSGKSELLRTLVLGLITTHSSATLNLVLVDFKGGATFAGLADAPHVAAVITNLADDLALVDRMQDALAGELTRRQELLRAAGNLASVADYERARERGADLAPLPALFVVVDEFSELLAQKPDLAEVFTAIGRLGRSLQVHLLLASQRVDEGRLRGLESHLSYRIGLRTFSAADSRAVLGVPDAASLPAVPGTGYLRSDTSTMVRFTAGYVSGPARRPGASGTGATPRRRGRPFAPRPFHGGWVEPGPDDGSDPPPAAPAPTPDEDTGTSVLDVIVDRLRDAGPPAHEVWLPPLEGPVDLESLLPPLQDTPDRGRHAPGFPANGTLRLPLGLVDRPYEQRREVLWADLSGAAGHVVVAGGPRAGTSTLLRTLICSAALTHTPDELGFHVIDLGGGALSGLAGLPHVGTVAGRGDTDLVRRVVAEVGAVATARERWFRERGIDSIADLRERRRRGEDLPDPFGDLVLVVDGWHAFRADHEALEAAVTTLATTGLAYGVHVAIGISRWAELRPALKDLLGTRIELRLGDPGESEVDRRVAAAVPAGRPGRGIAPDRSHVLVAHPDAGIVAAVTAAWPGPGVPPVALLPDRVDVADLPGPRDGERHLLPIGIDEERLAPVLLDTAADPHLLVYADGESGKTAFLRLLAHQVVTRYTPAQARLMIVDYRRGLLGAVDSEHLISYTSTADALTAAMTDLVASLRRRLPGPDVTPEQLRSRSWWTGPEVFLLVDDYDLVAGAAGNPLTALLDLLPQAKDVGLHVVVARRVGGTSRAMFEPVLARLRELATPGLVGNGSRDEGPLVGAVRPGPRPPGRVVLVTRRDPERLVQLAWRDPDEPIRPVPDDGGGDP